MKTDIDVINRMLNNYFSSSKSNNNDNPEYYVKVLSISKNKSIVFAEFAFKADETYCCSELTCHFEPNWEKIRSRAIESDVVLAKPLTIEFKVTVEKGAKFEVRKSFGLPLESDSYEYDEKFSESKTKT